MDTRSRFYSKTTIDDNGCLVWQASRSPKGYGYFGFEGRCWLAHRVAWVLDNGPIPSGMLVCHTCDNPPCVNVDHLFIGTHKDNTQDMVRKGRAPKFNPDATPVTKITQHDADEIRRKVAGGERPSAVAMEYSISVGNTYNILRGERWGENKHKWPIPKTKIDTAQVKRLYEATGNQSEVARTLGIHSATVSRIVRGIYWGQT